MSAAIGFIDWRHTVGISIFSNPNSTALGARQVEVVITNDSFLPDLHAYNIRSDIN